MIKIKVFHFLMQFGTSLETYIQLLGDFQISQIRLSKSFIYRSYPKGSMWEHKYILNITANLRYTLS